MEDCINFEGSKNRGYGQVPVWDRLAKKTTLWKAHRLVWTGVHGPIPEGMHVLHKCDNPSCINVRHLELGTHQDNMRQKMERNRHRVQRGEKSGMAKLNENKVREIRQLAAAGATRIELAEKYGVGRTAIHHVLIGHTWKHVQ